MSIGFLECSGFGTLLYAMDKACKAADIKIVGVDTINPKDNSAFIPLTAQAKFEGELSDVKEAIRVAQEAALQLNDPADVITSMIENPYQGTRKLAYIKKV